MTKKVREFHITQDKTHNLITEAMSRSKIESPDQIRSMGYEIICVPGANTTEDKYILLNNMQKQRALAQWYKGNTRLMGMFVVLNNQEVAQLFERARVASENRQKSGLVNNYYRGTFRKKTMELTNRYNEVFNGGNK